MIIMYADQIMINQVPLEMLWPAGIQYSIHRLCCSHPPMHQ